MAWGSPLLILSWGDQGRIHEGSRIGAGSWRISRILKHGLWRRKDVLGNEQRKGVTVISR